MSMKIQLEINANIKLDEDQMSAILGALAMAAQGGHPEDIASRKEKAEFEKWKRLHARGYACYYGCIPAKKERCATCNALDCDSRVPKKTRKASK